MTRTPRLVLVAFFALNPMILLYGGNGMSEGLYIFTLVVSTRYLLRWVQQETFDPSPTPRCGWVSRT